MLRKILSGLLLFTSTLASAFEITGFSPQGVTSTVSQVRVDFSEEMVALGDLGVQSPFSIDCATQGTGQWSAPNVWVYNFTQNVAPGTKCQFTLKTIVRSVKGGAVSGNKSFAFVVGGPQLVEVNPFEGSPVVEDQAFVLKFNADLTEATVLDSVFFRVEGLPDPIRARLVTGADRTALLKSLSYFGHRSATSSTENQRLDRERIHIVQAKLNFPTGKRLELIIAPELKTKNGVVAGLEQLRTFRVRDSFNARMSCERERPEAPCIPLSGIQLQFSSPITPAQAKKVQLRAGKKTWTAFPNPENPPPSEVTFIGFAPPFPENATLSLDIPPGLKDDTGRPLSNQKKFPLEFKTGHYPPLAKFAADFGLLESEQAALPVTVRRLGDPKSAQVKVRALRLDNFAEIFSTLQKQKALRRDETLLQTRSGVANLELPKKHDPLATEVVGIPLGKKGFHMVEIESQVLGQSLLNEKKSFFVRSSALVTDMAVHFKKSPTGSLVWVTSLKSGEPLAGADVALRDCTGKELASGRTDAEGRALLPMVPEKLAECHPPKKTKTPTGEEEEGEDYYYYDQSFENGFFVTARKGDDLSFVHSTWKEGLENWRFQVRTWAEHDRWIAHGLLDRVLLRPGETLHYKIFLRRTSVRGLELATTEYPAELKIQHEGSGKEYPLPLQWDRATGTAVGEWPLPKNITRGSYTLRAKVGENQLSFASFSAEDFRVPLLQASLKNLSEAHVLRPATVPFDLAITYLNGGGASGLPVTVKQIWGANYSGPRPEGATDFSLNNGPKKFIDRSAEITKKLKGASQKTFQLKTNAQGALRVEVKPPNFGDIPATLRLEVEYQDPSGDTHGIGREVNIYPTDRFVGVKMASPFKNQGDIEARFIVYDLKAQRVPRAMVNVQLYERKYFAHRKRLVGGFYAYDNRDTLEKVKDQNCQVQTDTQGLAQCRFKVLKSGNYIAQAETVGTTGAKSVAHADTYMYVGQGRASYALEDSDRMDIVPDKKQYQVGEVAKFQVKMPFPEATALITVEREGIAKSFVRKLRAENPVVEVPIEKAFAPNVFVSVLALRGRVQDIQPTALVDLAKPAFKMGLVGIEVGWREHELKVEVKTAKKVYQVREKVKTQIQVQVPAGAAPLGGPSEVALAVVDEGLLRLRENDTVKLLERMMNLRAHEVESFSGQMQVVGKRHFGLKALATGGGGGDGAASSAREFFQSLVYWNPRVPVDKNGRAEVEFPLNDSLTSFRVVAVAQSGADRFGTGTAQIEATQDLSILSGISPLLRQGDAPRSQITLRNRSAQTLEVEWGGEVKEINQTFATQKIKLASGESREILLDVKVPTNVAALNYHLWVRDSLGTRDEIRVTQTIEALHPARVVAADFAQLTPHTAQNFSVQEPKGAEAGRGGLVVAFSPRIVDNLESVRAYMRDYPYSCLEQKVSKSVATRDAKLWAKISAEISEYLDARGLAKYFPGMGDGSPLLTAYVLSLSHEAAWALPTSALERMRSGLKGFVEGRGGSPYAVSKPRLEVEKILALEALSRFEKISEAELRKISFTPRVWPTTGLVAYRELLKRSDHFSQAAAQKTAVEQTLKSRLNFQGSRLRLREATLDQDIWWYMASDDLNAGRLILSVVGEEAWQKDVARLVRGHLANTQAGHWGLTTANAWSVLALEKFSQTYEKEKVAGRSLVQKSSRPFISEWKNEKAQPAEHLLPWQGIPKSVDIKHEGSGRPWVTLRATAARPVTQSIFAGFQIKKRLIPIQQKVPGRWHRGDLAKVELTVDAPESGWAVIDDPIPAGFSILGKGLATEGMAPRASSGDADDEDTHFDYPVYEEKTFAAYRAYYSAMEGPVKTHYILRFNGAGKFQLPATRVEAMYAPENYAEIPNEAVSVLE